VGELRVVATESVCETVDASEWATRIELAACYRLVALYGMTDLVYNHISARVPGHHDRYLINPYGMLYEEVTASCLVTIDVEGRTLLQPDHGYSVNVAGFYLHAPVHQARPEVQCILHTHTRAGTAVSALAEGLMPLSQTAMRFHGQLAYHDFEGPAIDGDECARIVRDLGSFSAMVLRNHGLLVCGVSIAQAFNRMYWLEQACRIQVDALGCGRELHLPTARAIDNSVACFAGSEITLQNEAHASLVLSREARAASGGYGRLEWPALLRRLDRLDPGYRQ